MRDKPGFWATDPTQHSLFEDAQGIFAGCMMAAFGVALLSKAGLLTGGAAGIALLAHYGLGVSFGSAFFVINLPFYFLAWQRMGKDFTIKSFLAVALFSLIADQQKRFFDLSWIHPIFAAVLGGILLGMALLALYRHRASLGGVGILALYLQDRFGFRAGFVQMGVDGLILLASFSIASPYIIFCSVIGAVTINMFLAINHRKDRYIAM